MQTKHLALIAAILITLFPALAHAQAQIEGNVIRRVFNTPRTPQGIRDTTSSITRNLNNDGAEAFKTIQQPRNRPWETPWMKRQRQERRESYSRNDGYGDETVPAHRTMNRRFQNSQWGRPSSAQKTGDHYN